MIMRLSNFRALVFLDAYEFCRLLPPMVTFAPATNGVVNQTGLDFNNANEGFSEMS